MKEMTDLEIKLATALFIIGGLVFNRDDELSAKIRRKLAQFGENEPPKKLPKFHESHVHPRPSISIESTEGTI